MRKLAHSFAQSKAFATFVGLSLLSRVLAPALKHLHLSSIAARCEFTLVPNRSSVVVSNVKKCSSSRNENSSVQPSSPIVGTASNMISTCLAKITRSCRFRVVNCGRSRSLTFFHASPWTVNTPFERKGATLLMCVWGLGNIFSLVRTDWIFRGAIVLRTLISPLK